MRSEPALLVGKTKHAFANWERTLTPNLGISVKESVTSDICDQKLSSPRSVDGSPDIGYSEFIKFLLGSSISSSFTSGGNLLTIFTAENKAGT